jgi:hypothetical protein
VPEDHQIVGESREPSATRSPLSTRSTASPPPHSRTYTNKSHNSSARKTTYPGSHATPRRSTRRREG